MIIQYQIELQLSQENEINILDDMIAEHAIMTKGRQGIIIREYSVYLWSEDRYFAFKNHYGSVTIILIHKSQKPALFQKIRRALAGNYVCKHSHTGDFFPSLVNTVNQVDNPVAFANSVW